MKAEILNVLRESGDYVSGQQLCDLFGVSRTAVWKVINQIKEEGYQVDAVRNRGYRIMDSPDVCTKEELDSLMYRKTVWAGQNVRYFQETDSTNIQAKQAGEQGGPHGTLVVAETQTAGRGRRGRGWMSPPGGSIYMSLLLRPTFEPDKAAMLTLIMAYSVARALQHCLAADEETSRVGPEAWISTSSMGDGTTEAVSRKEQKIQIKWPNDIVLNGKKIVGILTEMSTQVDYISHVVIGVGINVNMESVPGEIREAATSLRIEAGRRFRRAPLIVEAMCQFEKNYERFVRQGDLSFLREEYDELLANKGKDVMVHDARGAYRAHALGINDNGELLVRREDGREEAVYAGEVSVRGLYGYV